MTYDERTSDAFLRPVELVSEPLEKPSQQAESGPVQGLAPTSDNVSYVRLEARFSQGFGGFAVLAIPTVTLIGCPVLGWFVSFQLDTDSARSLALPRL